MGNESTQLPGVTYVISDLHLGLQTDKPTDRERELLFCQLLSHIEGDCQHLILLGDIFDFWFEYRHVVPRGHIRALGALARLADRGIPIDYFTGNHDMWLGDYLPSEIGVTIHRAPREMLIHDTRILLGHGDGLGPGGRGYKYLKMAFSNPLLQGLFRSLHPGLSFRIARGWSHSSRKAKKYRYSFKGKDEPLAIFTREMAEKGGPRLSIMGHLHSGSIYREPGGGNNHRDRALVILGEWITGASYLRITPETIEMLEFAGPGRESQLIDREPLAPYREP